MIYVQIAATIRNGEIVEAISHTVLARAAGQTLRHENAGSEADITVVLSDDKQLHDLNRQFLGIDAPTDVLAFPSGETDPDSHNPYLGDVIISYPRALAQAKAGGHSTEAELQLLIVHGVLHLLGYDHATPEEKKGMWAAQAEILTSLGVEIPGLHGPDTSRLP